MANSYVDYRDRTVRVNDQLLTIIALLAADAVKTEIADMPLSSSVARWPIETVNSPPGLINIDLTGSWESDAGESALRLVLDRVAARIETFGDRIPAAVLNGLANEKSITFVETDVKLVLTELHKLRQLGGIE